ncbi:helix-turn-helix domain-containing protein [Candidatus Microthrix parvicella]|uniref:helix-turn-helix domain-containing protein n=1 Tax=Candidatus Neomicrothrix parvicella TaxID=41950 RepID=UPI0012DFA471
MSSQPSKAGLSNPPYDLDLSAAVLRTGRSEATLRRYVKSGRLPAARDGRRLLFTTADLDAACAPVPVVASEASLRAWAERVAENAPPFRSDQREELVTLLASALRGR